MCIVVENQPDFGHVLEDNVLALLDSVGVKNADDIEDDKMSFIEAVHTLSIAGTQPKAPTWSVHMAVYRLLEENHSLAVKMASYSLLVEIAQQYPHIFIRENNSRDRKRKAVLNMKIWSPFREDLIGEGKSKDRERNLRSDSEYPEEFVSLLREIQETLGEKAWLQPADEQKKKLLNLSTDKITGLILKFDYLFKIMEHDFNCWFRIFYDIRKLKIMSDCYLLTVFEGPRGRQLLELLFDLIASSSILCNCDDEFSNLQGLCLSLQKIVEMKLSFELEKRELVEMNPKKSRIEGSRSFNFMELLTSSFQFNKELLKILVQVMEDSDCKLRIIFANFLKDIPKPLAAERIRDPNNMTTQELLNCMRDQNSARSVYKVSDCHVLQVIIATAFKAELRHAKSYKIDSSTLELCKSLKAAFRNLQSISNEFHELDQVAKDALIAAEMMITFSKEQKL